MKVILSKLKWNHSENIYVTGFIRQGKSYIVEGDLLRYFSSADSISEFEQRLISANGQFSVIVEFPGAIMAAVDRLRNYPLFYARINGELILSDDCYKLAEIYPEKGICDKALTCLYSIGFTANNLTLIENIFQIEAGEYILEKDLLEKRFYYSSARAIIHQRDFDLTVNELEDVLREVFRDHFEALQNKFIAIPLSGGYDSRLIAALASVFHPQDLLCFTYGRENNREVAPAREAASRLGVKWINIVYNSQLIEGYMSDEYFNQYYEYASGLSSMFYLQDYFAVKYLKENRIIPEGTVFMPGFSGDSLAGSFFSQSFEGHKNKSKIASRILDDKFVLVNPDHHKKKILHSLILEKLNRELKASWKDYEDWEIKEMHAKFIINSAKVFSFFGYEYVLPFFDNKLIDFFTTLPFQYKLHKKLYDYVLTKRIFHELNVDLPEEINPTLVERKIQRVKEKVKHIIPTSIVNSLIDHKSPILYDEITQLMVKEIGLDNIITPRQANYYNAYITQWYIKKVREKYNLF
jgi:asparagine synthase (glutamine-hydrolysing)